MFKKAPFILILIFGILVITAALFTSCNPISIYNNAIAKEEIVIEAWAQVENVYQRRMDLIPNLVNTVKGYASHEKETLTAVITARSKATQLTLTKEALESKEAFNNFQNAQGELSSVLSRLMMITESYPNLKSNENFLALQTQLEGTENRIAVERRRYNQAVRNFNIHIRRFPNNLILGDKFNKKEMFSAQKGADVVPSVSFE